MSVSALRRAFPGEYIQKHFVAWNILSRALEGSTDRGANPIPVVAAMIEDVRNMRANDSDIEDEFVCPLFLRALPEKYSVFRQMLERE